MSISRVPLISPCRKELWDCFLADAAELDATGFPIRGSFGIGFSCHTDLSVAPTDAARRALAADNIQSVDAAKGLTPLNERQMANRVRQLLDAYTDLRPGQTVAFKKGTRIVAFARIVSPYRYEPARTESAGRYPHRWDYVILRKPTPAEATPMIGFIQTYYTNKIPYMEEPTPAAPSPEDVIKAAEEAEKDARIASIHAQFAHLDAQRVLLQAQLAAL